MMRTTAVKIYREEVLKIDNQIVMADMLGLSPNHYNMIERCKRGVSSDLIKRFSELAGETMDETYAYFKSHEVTETESQQSA